MTEIQVKCVEQTLKVVNAPIIASGGIEEVTMQFEFCSKWDGFTKTAVFYRDSKEVYNVLLVDDKCKIPNEVLADKGRFYFGVFGVNGVIRFTTEVLKYDVIQGSYILGSEPTAPTPDIYTQLMDLHNQILEQYNNIFSNINEIVAEAVLQGVVNQNESGDLVKFWFGSKEEYDAIETKDEAIVYIIEDEKTHAEVAEVANYASEDTSKGTIEERLVKVEGIKQGVTYTEVTNGTITSGGLYCITTFVGEYGSGDEEIYTYVVYLMNSITSQTLGNVYYDRLTKEFSVPSQTILSIKKID